MWTWPLDSTMVAQHLTKRQKEWPMGHTLKEGHGWLTSVGGGWREKRIYNSRYLPKEGWGEWMEALGKRAELGVHIFGRGVLSPWDAGPSDSMFLALIWSSFITPKQAVAPLEPKFWTHSLQIHYNGLGSKTETLQLAPSVGKVACAMMSAMAC